MLINENYIEWVEYATADLVAAKYLATMQNPLIEIVCYHCQQCAEKMLKGFIIYNDIEPKRIHDLTILCKECEKLDSAFQDVYEMCEILTEYVANTRYPSKIELIEYDMKEAIKFAIEIKEFVTNMMK